MPGCLVSGGKPINPVPQILACQPIQPPFGNKLDEFITTFRQAAACSLGQPWLSQAEPDFSPGNVYVGWRDDTLFVFAELIDRDIFTRATEPNQRLWELGDVFEIFLQLDGSQSYFEFHVSPNNQRLQMLIQDASVLERARASGRIEELIVSGKLFDSMTWVRPELQKWFAYVEIPLGRFQRPAKSLAGASCRISFSRYDYTRGRELPVLSSSSAHRSPDFHRRQEWSRLHFTSCPD